MRLHCCVKTTYVLNLLNSIIWIFEWKRIFLQLFFFLFFRSLSHSHASPFALSVLIEVPHFFRVTSYYLIRLNMPYIRIGKRAVKSSCCLLALVDSILFHGVAVVYRCHYYYNSLIIFFSLIDVNITVFSILFEMGTETDWEYEWKKIHHHRIRIISHFFRTSFITVYAVFSFSWSVLHVEIDPLQRCNNMRLEEGEACNTHIWRN